MLGLTGWRQEPELARSSKAFWGAGLCKWGSPQPHAAQPDLGETGPHSPGSPDPCHTAVFSELHFPPAAEVPHTRLSPIP